MSIISLRHGKARASKGEEGPERPIVPSAKVMFLGSVGLILMISIGGFLGYSDVAKAFWEKMDWMTAYERGEAPQKLGPDGNLWVSVGIDAKKEFNETHGLVHWFMNISLSPNSTLCDVLSHLNESKYVELRIYEQDNKSKWDAVRDYGVSNYLFDVQYLNFSGYRYIVEIDGIREDVGNMVQWLPYRWNNESNSFQYLPFSADKWRPSHMDSIIVCYTTLEVLPTDCCSGSAFQYGEYEGV